MIPLGWYLIFAAALFAVGLFTALTRKNAIGILIGVEMMLNAVIVNLLAFWHYWVQQAGVPQLDGLTFAAIVFVVAAAETSVGLALIISAYRRLHTAVANDMDLLKG
ncbi:MAG: NADH-quinone oxidoreductase subunit NuoK [Longilinea sp.]|nr:NADH-quinone oxidoreductase subunit NuoK [Longilinea sp.]MCA1953780.1 NADH-quinone oxidoreductase subunit NuoK [Anaerolinea sp.]